MLGIRYVGSNGWNLFWYIYLWYGEIDKFNF